ncbi:MAG TPA: hypothetical protein VGB90_09605 [Alphaproteobacteria bacterium]
MTMRHPLRNEWERIEARLRTEAALRPGTAEGAQARAMLALMPVVVDILEDERDRATPAPHLLHALAGAAANLVTQMVGAAIGDGDRRRVATQVMSLIHRNVMTELAPRRETAAGLILPD